MQMQMLTWISTQSHMHTCSKTNTELLMNDNAVIIVEWHNHILDLTVKYILNEFCFAWHFDDCTVIEI